MSCLAFREVMKYGIKIMSYCPDPNAIHNQTYKTKSLHIIVTKEVMNFEDLEICFNVYYICAYH